MRYRWDDEFADDDTAGLLAKWQHERSVLVASQQARVSGRSPMDPNPHFEHQVAACDRAIARFSQESNGG